MKFKNQKKASLLSNKIFEIQSIFFENLWLHEKSFMDFSAQKIDINNFHVLKFLGGNY